MRVALFSDHALRNFYATAGNRAPSASIGGSTGFSPNYPPTIHFYPAGFHPKSPAIPHYPLIPMQFVLKKNNPDFPKPRLPCSLAAGLSLLFILWMIPSLQAQPRASDAEELAAIESAVVLPEPIDDPLEPVNRGLWEVNKRLMIDVIQPTSKGYRLLVPKPLRTGIRNAGQLTFAQFMAAFDDLVQRARKSKLTPDEIGRAHV